MFLRIFIIAVVSSLFGTVVSYTYKQVYATILTMDFSEGASLFKLLAYNTMFCFGIAILYALIAQGLKRDKLANFVTNFTASAATIAFVFFQLKMKDPTFKDPSVAGMESYFNTFFIPILFFPALSWMTFKTLISKD